MAFENYRYPRRILDAYVERLPRTFTGLLYVRTRDVRNIPATYVIVEQFTHSDEWIYCIIKEK